jgi:putative transposase
MGFNLENPNENGYIESFNGKLRDECLNEHIFVHLQEEKKLVETGRKESSDEQHPHSSFSGETSNEVTKGEEK